MEDLILFDEAKVLKELGFNTLCIGHYENQAKILVIHYSNRPLTKEEQKREKMYRPDICNSKLPQYLIAAPTYRQAFKFFRDKYMLKGEVVHADSNGAYKFTIWRWNSDNTVGKWERLSYIGTYQQHEDAELACLKELIILIKEKK